MHRSYSGLFGQLDFNQAAPVGFLLVQKLAVDSLGATPYAIRLVPFAAGVLSMMLLYPVAMRLVGRRAAIIALSLFAVSEPLMSYAATNKQYSLDVAVALGLYALALFLPDQMGGREAIALMLGGAIAVSLSHPAAFILVGIAPLIVARVRGGRRRDGVYLLGIGAACLASFLAAFVLTRPSVEQVQRSTGSSGTSAPFGSDGHPGFLQTFGGICRELLGLTTLPHAIRSGIVILATLLALVGLAVVWKANALHAAMLALPAAAGFFASLVHSYPQFTRTFLFVIPALVILIAAGGVSLTTSKGLRVVAPGAAITLALLLGTAAYATIDQSTSHQNSEPVEALRYLARKGQDGDSLYVYLTAQYDFRYYLECGCFDNPSAVRMARQLWPIRPTAGHLQFAPALKSVPPSLIAGASTSDRASDYAIDLKPLRDRNRVWVLVIDASPGAAHALRAFLSKTGTRIADFPASAESVHTFVVLYNLEHPS
jgi:hypothetical protein